MRPIRLRSLPGLPAPRQRPRQLERREQVAFFRWVDAQWFADFCFAIPNGARRSARDGAKLRQEGMRAGAPDVVLLLPKYDDTGTAFWHGLAMEFKSPQGRLSDEQLRRFSLYTERGYRCVVVRSVDDAIACVSAYVGSLRPLGHPVIAPRKFFEWSDGAA